MISSEQINKALEKINPGLMKYIEIMDQFRKVDVSKNKRFQKLYNGFYRLR